MQRAPLIQLPAWAGVRHSTCCRDYEIHGQP